MKNIHLLIHSDLKESLRLTILIIRTKPGIKTGTACNTSLSMYETKQYPKIGKREAKLTNVSITEKDLVRRLRIQQNYLRHKRFADQHIYLLIVFLQCKYFYNYFFISSTDIYIH